MSQPPGPPDPDDPWARPASGQAPYGQPAYGQPAYGQPGYGYPGYGYPQPTNGKATAALWTGIASIVLTVCCGAGVLGLVPLVLGVKARSEIRRTGGQQQGDGMALAGIILGVTAVVLSLAVIGLLVWGLASGGAAFEKSGGTTV